jgi:hypothetical protein
MRQTITVIVLSVLISGPVLAQRQTQQKRQQNQQRKSVPFRQSFTLPGVKFSKDQQSQVSKIRKKYTPKLAELQKQRVSVYTRK